MAQQTAVEWYSIEIKRLYFKWRGEGQGENHLQQEIEELFEQAKKMEKMQTIEFANKWFEEYCEGLGDFLFPDIFYNEIYNK